MRKNLGKNQRKVLLLLCAGVALGLSRSPRTHFRIYREVAKEWREINRDYLVSAVKSLYQSKLVTTKRHTDGTMTLVLTDDGRKRALRYNAKTMRIKKPAQWDGKWRIVLYDIPERMRGLRLSLYHKLRELGFHELQYSVFAYPYECNDEVEYLIELYDARPYVRMLVVESIDDATPLLKHFKLSPRNRYP